MGEEGRYKGTRGKGGGKVQGDEGQGRREEGEDGEDGEVEVRKKE